MVLMVAILLLFPELSSARIETIDKGMVARMTDKMALRENEAVSRKVGVLLPSETYATYEQIARDEHITVAQVIARVAVEFVDVECHVNRSRRALLSSVKQGLRKNPKPTSRSKTGVPNG